MKNSSLARNVRPSIQSGTNLACGAVNAATQRDREGFLSAIYDELGSILSIAYHTDERNQRLIERITGEGSPCEKDGPGIPEPTTPSIQDVANRLRNLRSVTEVISGQAVKLTEII